MLCRECYNKRQLIYQVEYDNRKIKEYIDPYTVWLEQVKDLPAPLITEDQWIEICRYFNGCAVCGSESIDARAFFIQFRFGGKYTPWNVFPICERCNKIWDAEPNPFRNVAWFRHYKTREFVDHDSFKELVNYLQRKIEEVKALGK
jgi:hypothetical protein